MTLEEAIKRYTSNAFYEKSDGNLQGCLEFRQLAEWLKDYKRLLEQEPVLDKIRTEVESYQSDAFYPEDVMMNRRMVLEIIDKYREVTE